MSVNMRVILSFSIRFYLLLIIFVTTSAYAGGNELSISKSFDLFHVTENNAFKLSDKERVDALTKDYAEFFSAFFKERLNNISDNELLLLFRAAYIMEFYTANPRYRADMEYVLSDLERRGLAENAHYSDLYGALIHEREFSKALQLRKQHSFLKTEDLPDFQENSKFMDAIPTALFVEPEKNLLTRDSINIEIPALVIVVAHPLCHFCQYAVRDIDADQKLREIFTHHAIWLSPTETKLYFPIFQQWNKLHPDHPMVLAFNKEEWPMIDSWETPTFYFFNNGSVVAKLSGWPEEGRRKELLEGLRRIGLVE